MTRKIKVEQMGNDYWAKAVRPAIRLKGKWLAAAGFRSGTHVQVELLQQGVLLVRCPENVESERRVNEIQQVRLIAA